MNRYKLYFALAVATLIVGCATTDLKVPPVDQVALANAKNEIRNAPAITNTYVPVADADQALAVIFKNLQPSARSVCQQVGEDECIWDLELSTASDLNAHAEGESKVVINRGIFNYAKSDEEVAFVVAHEIGHHIADHIHETTVNATTGALIGGILFAALGAAAANPYDPYAQQRVNQMTRDGMNAGAAIGAVSFSVAEEKEADFLGAQILRGAGYEPRNARQLIITMGKLTGQENTGFLASHPAGPERLASYDQMLAMTIGHDEKGKLALVPMQDGPPGSDSGGATLNRPGFPGDDFV